MHTPAAVRLEGDGRKATLTLGGKQLEARILAPASARFEVRPAEPLPTSPNPAGQKSNEGVRKLAIHLPNTKDVAIDGCLHPARRPGRGCAAQGSAVGRVVIGRGYASRYSRSYFRAVPRDFSTE